MAYRRARRGRSRPDLGHAVGNIGRPGAARALVTGRERSGQRSGRAGPAGIGPCGSGPVERRSGWVCRWGNPMVRRLDAEAASIVSRRFGHPRPRRVGRDHVVQEGDTVEVLTA